MMQPPAEHVHWMFATGFLLLGLLLLAEAIVGREVWRRRTWRAYLWPSLLFGIGVFMWPVMVFFTNSTIHMLAHGAWAQVMMLAGAAELGLARGKLQSQLWRLCDAGRVRRLGRRVPGARAERLVLPALGVPAPPARLDAARRRALPARRARSGRARVVCNAGFALVFVVRRGHAVRDRDVAPVFGHLSPLAGEPHR